MAVERIRTSEFEIRTVTQEEFNSIAPSPKKLHELVYSLYTIDGTPKLVTPEVSGPLSQKYQASDKKTAYITAQGDVENLFQTPKLEHLKNIEQELRNYKNLGGFLKVEWGVFKPEENLPIEAMILIENYPWPPNTIIGYAASFTVNPLLPKQTRTEIQRDMHLAMYDLAEKEGFSDHIYTILAPRVLHFVEGSGLSAIKLLENSTLGDDPFAKEVFKTFPRYWETKPSVFRFVPNHRK